MTVKEERKSMKNELIEFKTKNFKFIKDVGQGGTGKTVLLRDDFINELFICKKYFPYYDSDKEKYFNNFIEEIKILHKLHHTNIVRVFNYYLYPEKHTGYILMEYVEGFLIDEYIKENPDRLNDIFIQTINGFKYLEENKILHRDIRPGNILISDNGIVKIIDFGFGKKIEIIGDFYKSITLNWRYTVPNELYAEIYDFTSEVYFVGKLFDEIIRTNNLINFKYQALLIEMIAENYENRIKSFFDVSRSIISEKAENITFTTSQKNIYQQFANNMIKIISKISYSAEYISDIETITLELENIYRNSILEDFISKPYELANCFIRGEFYHIPTAQINVESLNSILTLLRILSIDKRKIVFNNLWRRLDTIKRYNDIDDLPF